MIVAMMAHTIDEERLAVGNFLIGQFRRHAIYGEEHRAVAGIRRRAREGITKLGVRRPSTNLPRNLIDGCGVGARGAPHELQLER